MANYTKIGRIRPDYADTWDASRSYTALEMVKSADSYHAYIAKQDVPAGTPLTNAEYWGEVLDVSDVIAESVAATNRANTAAANADAAREAIQDDLNGLHDELHAKGDAIVCAAEGETITLTDSSDDPVRELRIFGKTEQVTTTGKNLFGGIALEDVLVGLGCQKNGSDGSVHALGGYINDKIFYDSFKDNTRYTFVFDIKTSQQGSINIQILYTDGTTSDIYPAAAGVRQTLTYASVANKTVKSLIGVWQADTYYYCEGCGVFESAIEESEFEPYTGGAPSPSLDWQQPLVNKGKKGSIGVTVCGKNLFDGVFYRGTLTVGDDYTDGFSDKSVLNTLIGETYATFGGYFPKGTYVFSYTNNGWFALNRQAIAGTICKPDSRPIRRSFSWTQAVDGYTYFSIEGDAAENNFDDTPFSVVPDLQIEHGLAATNYEAPKHQTLTALTPNGLPGVPVSSGGNYTDAGGQQWICDEIDFGRGVYVKRIGKRTLNGSEAWNMNDGTNPENNNYIYYTSAPDVGIGICMCDRLPCGMLIDKDFVAVSELYGGVIYVRIKEYMTEDSLSAFKVALAQYPLTVIYPLTTPIETPLTADEIAAYRALHTNKPNTSIYNDEGAHMAVEYNADTKTYIDNKISELAAAIVNTNA